jgi:ribonuclease BN (tRNA processing enzyme)
VRLTILGKSPSWQDRDGACSGYLVQVGDRRLLIDCGNGVFAKLRRYEAYERVDAIVISHLHADHLLDLVPFAYALSYGAPLRASRPQLHAPPGAQDALRSLCRSWGSPALIDDAFEVHEYDPAAGLALADAHLRFQPVPHYVPAYAIDLQSEDSPRRLVFSSDCGPNDELSAFAADAELLLIESTLLDAQPGEPSGHLTAAQAGAIGRHAGARRLVLTHFSDQLDGDELRARAEAAFGGPVELAAEGAVFEL